MRYVNTNNIEVVLVPKTADFKIDDKDATQVTSEYFYNFVLGKIQKIDNQQQLYDQLLKDYNTYIVDREQREREKKATENQ